MKLSILICTIPSRYAMLGRLRDELRSQILPYAGGIEVLTNNSDKSIGEKRNALLQLANGEYVCFIDDDDQVSNSYIELLMKAIESACDCASLKGIYYVDGKTDGIFEHSLKYKKWETVPNDGISNYIIKYLRFPNHLNMIKASIAKQFSFPEKNHGEDFDWSTKLHESGLLKTEYYITEVIYYYRYVSKK